MKAVLFFLVKKIKEKRGRGKFNKHMLLQKTHFIKHFPKISGSIF